MSGARSTYIREIAALATAVSSPNVGTASPVLSDPGAAVLRRGAAVTGQIMLESFVRQRVEEVLLDLQQWPAQYDDLPQRFRDRAILDALPNIEKYGKLLKRQQGDYVTEIVEELEKLVSIAAPNFRFTKFMAGDYTGNLSDEGLKELLSVFQVKDCWNAMHSLSVDVGFGVPSVREVVRSIVNNRHRSAHVGSFSPSASDVLELPQNLRLIGVCVDAALAASVHTSVRNWQEWVSSDFNWLQQIELYILRSHGSRLRLTKRGSKRAIRILQKASDASASLLRRDLGKVRLVVQLGNDGRPWTWDIP